MAIYSVGRRRVILALLLTSALLLTLDLRGNPIVDRSRDAFTRVMNPVESAVGVVTTPLERAWNGIVNYDDLERENQALQDENDRLIGTRAAAEAAVLQSQEILALNNLPALAKIDTELAQVIGRAANNIDQVIEINKGRNSGIEIGMPVVNQAGLVGRITSVNATTARVMLITDTRYTVGVTITGLDEPMFDEVTADTTPSGLTPSEVVDATTTTVITLPGDPAVGLPTGPPIVDTTLPGATTGTEVPNLIDPNTGQPADPGALTSIAEAAANAETDTAAAGSQPADGAAPTGDTTSGTTTTTMPVVVQKDFGALTGGGRRRLPQVRFLQDNPALAELKVGDLVETAGDSGSLAPTGIPVGRVVNRVDRPGSGGPVLEVELNADLSRLNYVRVVIYKSPSEAGQ
jgi:rod shape-determining protein MreC